MSNCEQAEKRTLTVALKQAAAKGMDLVKLAGIIEDRLGGTGSSCGPGEVPAPKPKPDCLLETAIDINNYLSQAISRLDRVAANL